METGEPLSTVRDRRALGQRVHRLDADRRGARAGAQRRDHRPVAPTRRSPWRRLRFEFGWGAGDWDRLAAGHHRRPHHRVRRAVLRRATASTSWRAIPDLGERRLSDRRSPGRRHVRRHQAPEHRRRGDRARASPSSWCTRWAIRTRTSRPTCVADFTTIRLDQAGRDRVRVLGIKGRPATELLKVSIAYRAGFKAVGSLVYAWPDALEKAQLADRVLRERLRAARPRLRRGAHRIRRLQRHARSAGRATPAQDAARGAVRDRRPLAATASRWSGSRARSRRWC